MESIFDLELGTTWPLLLCCLITVLCFIYLWELTRSYRSQKSYIATSGINIEGFTNSGGIDHSGIDQRIDDACYDEFYSKVYDLLVQPIARAPMETKVSIEWMEKNGKPVSDIRVADIGCGTGLHVDLFAQQGVKSIVGYDSSAAMIAEAKSRFPTREFIVGNATVATMAAASQFDLVTMFYFTLYLIPERTQMLQNIFLWLDMGGVFAVHIVNKNKFDPLLEACSPFVGFSVQKYADERITKSQVEFDKFSYTADFNIHGSRATYEEVFTFKNGGAVRRHEHRIWMPDIHAIVSEIEGIGFKLAYHVDLTPIGYEYNYIFFFHK
jgi:ubiquinone/menaquinone biosynthesis C-methylase UbiE